LSKFTTVARGIIITGFAFFVGNISDTVIESINKIGSAFYGPVLAAFLVGILSSRANAGGVFAGVLAGVGFNLMLWLGYPEVFWMWWNLSGLAIAVVVTFIVGRVTKPGDVERARPYTLSGSGFFLQERLWRRGHSCLLVYFFLMLGFMLLLDGYASWVSTGL
jgi:SSS family solute:Na+ symporter